MIMYTTWFTAWMPLVFDPGDPLPGVPVPPPPPVLGAGLPVEVPGVEPEGPLLRSIKIPQPLRLMTTISSATSDAARQLERTHMLTSTLRDDCVSRPGHGRDPLSDRGPRFVSGHA